MMYSDDPMQPGLSTSLCSDAVASLEYTQRECQLKWTTSSMRLRQQGKGPTTSYRTYTTSLNTMESAKRRCTCMLTTVQVRIIIRSWCGIWHGESCLACTQPSVCTSCWLATSNLRRTGVLASSRGSYAEPECCPWQTLLVWWKHPLQPTPSLSAMRQEMCPSLPSTGAFSCLWPSGRSRTSRPCSASLLTGQEQCWQVRSSADEVGVVLTGQEQCRQARGSADEAGVVLTGQE